MGYTKYCNCYADYTIVNKLTNHLVNKLGAKAEVDWSEPTMNYMDISIGKVITVHLFVGTLPYSQYSYVEPTPDMKMDSFIRAHVHMYEFFDGVPTRLVCDNLKTDVVSHPKEDELVLTQDYEALGEHYTTAITSAGVHKPKHKPSVKGTVGKIASGCTQKQRDNQYLHCNNKIMRHAYTEWMVTMQKNPFHSDKSHNGKLHAFGSLHILSLSVHTKSGSACDRH